jgi:alpha-L-rhamnosidase
VTGIDLINLLPLSLAVATSGEVPEFRTARPIWPEGRETEKNLFVGFRAVVDVPAGKRVLMRVAGSTVYRAFVNGAFCGYGPARGPHGYYRQDKWDLTHRVEPGKNVVAIEVAGYNANSYYLLDQPSFLQAEIMAGDDILASTAGDGAPFEATILTERVQKVQRYSFQRPFSEVYRLRADHGRWRREPEASFATVACAVTPAKRLLARGAPYPDFSVRPVVWNVSEGTLETGHKVEKPWKDRSLTGIGPKLGGYPERELAAIPSLELQTVVTHLTTRLDRPASWTEKISLGEKSYCILDLGANLTGFVGAKVTCRKPSRLMFTFDEILTHEDVDFKRMGCVNIVDYTLGEGVYHLESFEPYTLRYLKLLVLEGACEIEGVYLREYANSDVWGAHFAASDERLNRLFAAGRSTFAQNAVDVFMDCPSRERAGWLCDSFFTARVERDLTGGSAIERNFMENFLLPARFEHLPKGMLPMCYPSDHNDGVFIPNWAMWFVLQLEEYYKRTGDFDMVKLLEPKVLGLFEYFKPFLNSDGLLEKLQSWVFIEWSKANRFVQDVNYPTNMLYAAALAAAGRMYDRSELTAQAERMRQVIRRQSFDGEFFVDNAVRKDGKLEVTKNHSEVCQYFAFFFDVATPETHAKLWRTLVEQFGPKRKDTKLFSEVHPANSFVGNMLRIELLSRAGRSQQVLDESVEFLLYMADRTGTLWENVDPSASCNHGFASHIVHTLYRDVLGVRAVDPIGKVVRLRFADSGPAWCEGRMPTPAGPVEVRWRREGTKLLYRVGVPAGYTLQVEHEGDIEPIRQP